LTGKRERRDFLEWKDGWKKRCDVVLFFRSGEKLDERLQEDDDVLMRDSVCLQWNGNVCLLLSLLFVKERNISIEGMMTMMMVITGKES
jgi:hypothetical protein